MEARDKDEFLRHLAEIYGAVDRNLTESRNDGYFKGLAKMSLAQFVRCKDKWLEGLAEHTGTVQPKPPTVNDIWSIHRKLRASGPTPAATVLAAAKWQGDQWDELANARLWKWISRHAAQVTSDAVRTGVKSPDSDDPLPEDREMMGPDGPFLQAKKYWAIDMREWDGVPTKAQQDEAWREAMEKAIAWAKKIRAKYHPEEKAA